MTETILNGVFIGIQYFLMFFWIYWFTIGLFGFGKPKEQKEHEPKKRFLILVPAHNEENVVGALIENLHKLDYPKELYDITVIADNCNDNTVKISQELGANVIEHTSKPDEPKGKPYGIKYALDVIGDRLTEDYDAVAFFDADNLVSLNYLKEMNNHLMNGDKVIQCYLDTKNPNDNWITLSYATSYYYMNRSWQLAKSKMGLGNAIGGTGFTVDAQLLKEIGWSARSLTEDLEFTMQCLLKGVATKWSHKSRIYDEKPEKFVVSMVQRLRWARGHWDVCFKYSLPLLWRAITKLDMKSFDGVIYLINPGKIIINVLTSGMVFLTLFDSYGWLDGIELAWFSGIMPWWLWVSMFIYQFFYITLSFKLDTKEKINPIKAFISLAFLNITYLPLFFWSLFTKNNKTWKRTEHTRSIAIDERMSETNEDAAFIYDTLKKPTENN